MKKVLCVQFTRYPKTRLITYLQGRVQIVNRNFKLEASTQAAISGTKRKHIVDTKRKRNLKIGKAEVKSLDNLNLRF